MSVENFAYPARVIAAPSPPSPPHERQMSERPVDLDALDALAEAATAKWLAVKNETRGVGVDGAGDLRSPKTVEDFEHFIYRHFGEFVAAYPSLAAELRALREALRGAIANLEHVSVYHGEYDDDPDVISARQAWASDIAKFRAALGSQP